MQEPPNGYTIAELHAYAMAKDYQDEADALCRYLKLRQHNARGINFLAAAVQPKTTAEALGESVF
jgi:hypothetical protein